MKRTILTVDDEHHILELLKYTFEVEGYTVLQADTARKAIAVLQEQKVDIVVLDLILPDMDGFELLRRIRGSLKTESLPVLMLTARSEELDRVIGLELGADDYLCKPFFVRELVARIKALFRRSERFKSSESILKSGNLIVDLNRHAAIQNGSALEFTRKEFDLLCLLLQNPGIVMSREEMFAKIWRYHYVGETRTVDVHIRQLRKKLKANDEKCRNIITVRGVGYKWKEDVK